MLSACPGKHARLSRANTRSAGAPRGLRLTAPDCGNCRLKHFRAAQRLRLDKQKKHVPGAYFIDNSFLRMPAASLASGDNSRYLVYASLAAFVSFILSCALPSFSHASAFPSFHKVASM